MKQSGQTLVTVLVFVSMAMIIIGGAVAITIINSRSAGVFAQGEQALYIAEAGMENALIRLLRDSNYSGESLVVDDGLAIITVTGGTTKNITVEGIWGDYRREIEVVGDYVNNQFTISSWEQVD